MTENKCITYGSPQFALFLPDPQNADAQQKKGKLRLPLSVSCNDNIQSHKNNDMLRKLITMMILAIFATNLFGQNTASVSGKIYDKTTNEPLPYATVSFIQKSDNKILSGTIADSLGKFILIGIPEGEYNVEISFIGYKNSEIFLLIGKLNKTFDLGKIEMEPETNSLNEVIVTAKKEIISKGLELKSYNITDNISQSGGSVLEVMRNLPGITVDNEGVVLLRGSDKITVLIDGKQSSLTGFGNQKGLGNIPVTNIERIEIINNPSAKYSSSGMAGIINIVYKKEKETGFNGEISLNAGVGEFNQRKSNLPNIMDKYSFTPKLNPAISLNYRTKKINLFLQTDGIVRKKVNSNEFITRKYTDGSPDIASQFLENRTQQLYNIKGGLDWYINDNNTLTVYSLFEDEYHIDRGHVPYDYISDGSRKRFWTWAEDENTRFINYAANFKHKFSQPGHGFEIGYIYTKGGEDELFPFTDSSATRNSTDQTHLIVNEIISNFNIDYTKPLRFGRFEAGTKIQLRNIPISYKIEPGNNSILNKNLGDWSQYKEDIFSAYGNLIHESNKLDIEGGLRLEQTVIKYNIDPINLYYTKNESYDYISLFPNIRFTFKFNSNNKLSLFYNRRVDRPGEFELRPFPKYDDPEILKTGNPYLRPQFTQTCEVAYKINWSKGSLFAASYYRLIENIYSRIYTIDNQTGNTVINAIPQNLGNGTNLGFEIASEQQITAKWSVNANFNWYRNTINSFNGQVLYPYQQNFTFDRSKNYTWNIKLNSNIKLPYKTDFQITAVYYAPDIIPQGKIMDRYSIDFGINKKILDPKLELTISATDVFNTFGIEKEIQGDKFTLISENYFETQIVMLGLKYKF